MFRIAVGLSLLMTAGCTTYYSGTVRATGEQTLCRQTMGEWQCLIPANKGTRNG